MRRYLAGVIGVFVCVFLWLPAAMAQRAGQAEWPTNAGNPQRTAWQQDETKISTQSVQNLQLLWSVKTDNKPMGLAGLTEPIILSDVRTSSGTVSLAVVAGSSDNVYAINVATGKIVWQDHLPWMSDTPQEMERSRGFICQNALTATPVATPMGGTGGRFVYVLTADGYLHTLDLATGKENGTPIKDYPNPYPKPNGLNLFNNVVYTFSGQGCGSSSGRNANSIYAVNLLTKKTTVMQPTQAGMWGDGGPTIGPDGTVYGETGDGQYDAATMHLSTSVLAVTPEQQGLKIKNWYTPSDYEWLTQRDQDMQFTPPLFSYRGQEYLVASGKIGRYFLIDTKTMGGADHMTAAYVSPHMSDTNVNFQTEGSWGNGASWQDKSGTRWVYVPIGGPTNPSVKFPITYGPTPHGGLIAMKVEEQNGKPVLTVAWRSHDMVAARTPVIANGVVFVLAGGQFTGQANDSGGGLFSADDRVERSVPAVLYALDAETGKELWNSGQQVTSLVHQAGLALANGQVIFGTNDGTVYCFGLK